MAMSLSFCRTRTTDKSKHMSHTHAAARSFDLARHPSRCETVELSNREVLDSSTVSQQQHGAKRHCVGFLTTQAFYPPPNKVAKRPAFELSCQTELVTYKAKARVSLFEARAFSLLWVIAKRYHVGLYAIAGYSRWQASMTLGPFLGGVGNEKT